MIIQNIATQELSNFEDTFPNVSDPTPEWIAEQGYTIYIEPSTPVVTVPPVPSRRLTKLQFLNRFTDLELATIYTAAKSEIMLEIWLAKFNAATPEMDGTSIDLDDPRTIAGIQALEASGLLSDGRSAEILL